MSTAPHFVLPERLAERSLDILAVGSLVLEQIVMLARWPARGGQDVVRVNDMAISAGGCAVNVACYAGRLGASSAVVSTVGDGQYSRPVLDELAASGASAAYLKRYPGKDGSLILILSNPEGDWATLEYMDREFILEAADLPAPADFARARFLHVDGFSFMTVGNKSMVDEALRRAREAGCLISIDSSVPAARNEPEYLRELFQQADIVFANLFEALAITQTQTVEAATEVLQGLGPQAAIIKMGKDGSYVITRNAVQAIPAFPVEVVDTVAAGDAYIAATLTALCRGRPLVEAATRGSAAGALACRGAGSLSSRFTQADVEALLQRGAASIGLPVGQPN